jgi:hypothetical protein
VALVAGVTKDLTDRVKAGDLMREFAGRLGGKGGGRPDMAQGGGSDVAALPAVLEAVPGLGRRGAGQPDMALIVQKFGGTSVGSIERIEQVADKVARFRERAQHRGGRGLAMSGETNRLIGLAQEIRRSPCRGSWMCCCPPASR